MAQNRKYEHGTQIPLPVIAGKVSGDPTAVGDIPGVCLTDRDANGNATVQTDGVFDLSVIGNDGTSDAAIAVGAILYVDDATGRIDVDTSKKRFGYAMGAVVSGATTTIEVKIGY